MQEYVLVYAKPVIGPNNLILVVLKNRPAWQVGKVNLIGGKVETGETPEEAAIRELKEETGLDPIIKSSRIIGQIQGSWGKIYCVKIPVSFHDDLKPADGESELVCWTHWDELKNHELLIPNLRVAIPLMRDGIVGWVITDECSDWQHEQHTFSITVASHDKSKGEPRDRY